MSQKKYTRWLESLTLEDVAVVGGKNASLGEMVQNLQAAQIRVPAGFATTAVSYRTFLEANDLVPQIKEQLDAWQQEEQSLDQTGQVIRRLFRQAAFPDEIAAAIEKAYQELSQRYDQDEVDVAVRSSATAEDLPDASFAGQQETFLNISGTAELLDACQNCYASLFTDRALTYRQEKGFDHLDVALSVGVQKMVRADKAGSGVMFTLDTETGFPDVVVINAAWGLGETVVQGSVTPDEYRIFKPLLGDDALCPIIEKTRGDKQRKMIYTGGDSRTTKVVDSSRQEQNRFVLDDTEILQLARWAVAIEDHYERPMDIEWAKDGDSNNLFIVQARPETVQSQKEAATLQTYTLQQKGKKLVSGLAIGQSIISGDVCMLQDAGEIDRFTAGSILVTGMTDPDWVPIMKQAAAIVTDHGGRTSHAAIVSRELGVPAVVGCGDATDTLSEGQTVTVSCATGEIGLVYDGQLDYSSNEIDLDNIPKTDTHIMINIATPDAAFRWWRLPVQGIGLARMEFIINNVIQIHPLALVHFDELEEASVREKINELTRAYACKTDYFVDHLAQGIAKIAATQYPHPVIVRLSDFKTNEYADLIGGRPFEPTEENPMLGWRGASRYDSDVYRPGFELECAALKRARQVIGLDNIIIMVPFCRTLTEADRVLEALAENGLRRGENGLKIYVMGEIPANVLLAEQFAARFDGISIGSNDLTQLVLGVDRDSARLADLFDERDEAVRAAIQLLLQKTAVSNTYTGICGQAPSDYPDFAAFLVRNGIDSISLNPDSVLDVIEHVAAAEAKINGRDQ